MNRVVLLHGFGSSGLALNPLARHLRKAHFQTDIWSYPSLTVSIELLAEKFASYLLSRDLAGPINVVAHSMGSVIVRASLPLLQAECFRRIVFLAPPMVGSPLAQLVPSFLYRRFPPLRELTPGSDLLKSLPMPHPDQFASICARFDVQVPVRFGLCNQAKHHITLNQTHNGLLVSPKTFRLAVQFLQSGRLDSPA